MPPNSFDDQLDNYIFKHLEPAFQTKGLNRLSLLVNGDWITGEVPVIESGPEKGKFAWSERNKSEIITLKTVSILMGSNEAKVAWLCIHRDHITAYEWIADEPDFSSLSLPNSPE